MYSEDKRIFTCQMLVTLIIRTGISDAVSFPRKRRVQYMARTRFSLITHTQAERETRVCSSLKKLKPGMIILTLI